MADYAQRQISQLSGGQQQRVFLARALAQEARLYFMDEPFAGVDAATERAIVRRAARGCATEGRTVIVVHHDLQTVPEYFDHVLLLNMRVIAAGPVAPGVHRRQPAAAPTAAGWRCWTRPRPRSGVRARSVA